jgi:hypothetical protein
VRIKPVSGSARPIEVGYFVSRAVDGGVTDELSVVLGSTLLVVMLVGAVVVGMKMALVGQFALAAGVLLPLLIVAYLVGTDGGLLA